MRLHRHGTCEQLHRVSGGRREKILKIRVDSERGNPIAMDDGLRFAIREGGRTVGAGVVAKVIA
ncbi:hypothetical protein [Serratia bockelmannii]|uniref:EF-Tu C-terminal domain-related protein n=1 Tax=Serratia bockelmannii TaxID=2703793 RepID=UPI003CE75809